jgi:micrococcal nuclease
MKRISRFLVLLFLLSCNHPESNEYTRHQSSFLSQTSVSEAKYYKVIGIKDGDTFVLLVDGKEQVVRLAHIDCPEKKQPFGKKAKQFASDICYGKYAFLNHNNKYDRNKRLIAEVILENGTNVNKELIKNGLAWHFKRYSDSKDYEHLELAAKNNKIGIWSDLDPIAPWNWRKSK